MTKLETRPYRGTRDFLPEEMSVRTQIFERMFEIVERFGFVRYDGPILESAAIYEAKSGEEIANQQLYHLEDKKGRRLALRPEMTPSVARMIASRARKMAFPARWYSHVNCHRYENPQRGRVREHWQLNVDIFGSLNVEAEVEIFDVIHALMTGMGAKPEMYRLRVNDRILVEGALRNFLKVPEERLVDVGMCIDRWEKSKDEGRQKMASEAGLSDEQVSKLKELITFDLDAYCKAAGEEATGRSQLVKIVKNAMTEAPLVFDPLIMRAFNYYTSTVFEVFDTSPDNNRSVFGGGRYDDLASLFTDDKIPGIGFGMGDVTTWNFLESHGLLPKPDIEPQVYAFATEPAYQDRLRSLARALRSAGLRAVIGYEPLAMKKGLKNADRVSAPLALMLAENEMKEGVALVKNLKARTQHKAPFDEIVAVVRRELEAAVPGTASQG